MFRCRSRESDLGWEVLGRPWLLGGLRHGLAGWLAGWLVLGLWQTVRDFLRSGHTAQNFLCLDRTVQDFFRSGDRKWVLGQFGSETVQNHYFLKGIFRGSRRPTFSRILGVLSVLVGLPRLGQTVRDFLRSCHPAHHFPCFTLPFCLIGSSCLSRVRFDLQDLNASVVGSYVC